MLCCHNCFNDTTIQEHIINNGKKDNCSFCSSKNVFCIPPEELNSLFELFLNLYSPIETFVNPEKLENYVGKNLWEKIQDAYDIFHENTKMTRYELFKRIFSKQIDKGENEILHSYYDREYEFYGLKDRDEKKLESEWLTFTQELKSQNRFFPTFSSTLSH